MRCCSCPVLSLWCGHPGVHHSQRLCLPFQISNTEMCFAYIRQSGTSHCILECQLLFCVQVSTVSQTACTIRRFRAACFQTITTLLTVEGTLRCELVSSMSRRACPKQPGKPRSTFQSCGGFAADTCVAGIVLLRNVGFKRSVLCRADGSHATRWHAGYPRPVV